MTLRRDRWIEGPDGLLYSSRANRNGLVLVARWDTRSPFFKCYQLLKTMPIDKLPEEVRKEFDAAQELAQVMLS